MYPEDKRCTFEDLPKDVKLPDFTNTWSYGRGGSPFHDNQYYITYQHLDGHKDVYPVPEIINDIINLEKQFAGDEVRKNIRKTLGIH